MRIVKVILILVVIALVLFFGVMPTQVDKAANRADPGDLDLSVGAAALALHETLNVVDLHADPLLWRRDLLKEHDYGHVDIPRLVQGNVAVQVFAAATKSPANQNYDSNPSDSDMLTSLMVANLQPPATWGSLYERALYQAEKLRNLEKRAPDRLSFIRSAADLETLMSARAEKRRPVGGIMALEGAHALEGKLENLDGLYNAGYRIFGLAHFFDNEMAGSMHGLEKYGLTELGRQAIHRAEELGMIIDLAHSSPAAIHEVLDIATQPLIVSHGGVKATCDVNRNLDDDMIRRVAANGGLIGVGFWDAAVCNFSPQGIVAAMIHIRDLVGVSYIALGSDFDGGVLTRFDISQIAVITQALMEAEFSEDEIAAIMGGNAIKLFYQVLSRPMTGASD